MQNQILNIEKLDLGQKFLVMEELWNSLSNNIKEDDYKWHLDILEKRGSQTDFIDLEVAKQNLKKFINYEN